MSQVDQLVKNVESIVEKASALKEKTLLAPKIPKIDITSALLTKRQIAKKMLMMAGGIVTDTGEAVQIVTGAAASTITSTSSFSNAQSNNQALSTIYDVQFAANAAQMIGQRMTPETAHFIVYGKFKRDANGNLIDNEILDPDCVFHKLAMPDTHPKFADIQALILKVLKTLSMIPTRLQDLIEETLQATMSIIASITSIASAAAIFPPGSGIPVAFAAFQSMLATIMNLLSKVSGIAIDMEYLSYIPTLIDASKLDAILAPVNALLIAINTALSAIDGVTKIIPSAKTPPGVGNEPGEPIEIEATANPDELIMGQPKDVRLSVKATKGSWDYNYKWTGPAGFTSTEKEVIIKGGPVATTVYRITVTDKKDSSNSAFAQVLVKVNMRP